MAKGTCFVIQGFGKKTDYTDGRILDLDASYEIIREAVVGAGLECIRADEIVHSGTIDKPMYEMLLDADLVIADLSTYNVNAAFELGVRYGLRPRATLIVAEEQFRNPFDVSHISIRRYRHLGEEIGYKEARRFRTELQQAIEALLAADSTDSPVYTFLPGLHPPRRPGLWLDGAVVHYAAHPPALDVDAFGPPDPAVGASPAGAPAPLPPPAASPAPPPAPSPPADSVATPSAKELLEAARACINPPAGQPSDFAGARVLLEQVRALRPNDPFVLQQLAFSIYKSRLPSAEAALQDARDVLLQLDPATTNDPETLGLWGAIHKRLWDAHRRREDLDRAINAYERGFHLRQDGYNGINLAYLLDLRAREALRYGDRPDEAVADSVQARRMRQEVLRITEAADAVSLTDAQRQRGDGDLASRYWRLAIRWEAALGLGDAATAARLDAEARALAVPQWMQATRLEQGDALCRLQAEVAAARAAR
ncbi:hypothetical protein dqs_3914 [Azoarcus olearius]|uniref:TRAFs-binding domain-containing protein n=1 Tax=Azoarcus sp. (strain BH72) TaxID=418699 RepID=UPI0008061A8E|nr:TRAFs-binding domain-containing protein [Azoarcus olearius]ANQ86931.1 hypothetical protein dqs_3914 [Azoarcus olearius]